MHVVVNKKFLKYCLNDMKVIICFVIILNLFLTKNSFANRYGNGELKLSPDVVEYFILYIRGKQFQYPSSFYVTNDGTDAVYWYCGEMTNCREGSVVQDLKKCFDVTGKDCGQFARKRTIKWVNDINPGKGKISQIKNKWSDTQIKSKLKDLGFIE